MSGKITPDHLDRGAVVYIRQSTAAQVLGNLESQRRQYALADAARAAGFTPVAVIDDDLGRSGSGAVGRPGFEKLVAAVCTGSVGAVYCLEASRLARNGRDWHHLLDLCALVGTLVIDHDGTYDPASRYPYSAGDCSARTDHGHGSGASALWSGVRARLAGKRIRPRQLCPGCLPGRDHAEDSDRGDEPVAGGTEQAREQAHAPCHPGAGPPCRPGQTGRSGVA